MVCMCVSVVVSQIKVRTDLVGQQKKMCLNKKKISKNFVCFFFQIINRYLMVKKREKQIFWGRIINAMCENIRGGGESCVRA